MYIKMEEEKINEIQELTTTDYDSKLGYIHSDNLVSMIDDLLYELHNLQDKLKDLQNEMENNYELKDYDAYEEFGVSREDFI